ncbi:hypothetical protein MGG_15966 [Pyricularia oryzae 70-15]|uniref:Uncharacterized protein n=3 Tax=Pyricularia oryzae TaxID=318829 RepID=G4MXU7_PYRO7|nr:uncharacterized protein MGG_15966 [Pyricularia oryzae 70-15]EHA56037.1 hypothetical protein MGG_15966 [Pyricularia oryzae 70-15]ELQ45005.1 hypothetical protein OOU_Y34scaffold00027g2 [Pyricularia oryzae Y34]KAI7909764.1 hypothetical protein M9X92_011463 [Pyricularia oryzae]KAI7910153.1 hypothetical protein M0657_011497 [Pyricularia oryzae]
MAPPAKAMVTKNTGKSSNIIIGITDEGLVATGHSGTRGLSASASASKVGCRPGAWYGASSGPPLSAGPGGYGDPKSSLARRLSAQDSLD